MIGKLVDKVDMFYDTPNENLLVADIDQIVLAVLGRFAYSRNIEVSVVVEFALTRLLMDKPMDGDMGWNEIAREMREAGADRLLQLRALMRKRRRKGVVTSHSENSSRKSTPQLGIMDGLREPVHATSA